MLLYSLLVTVTIMTGQYTLFAAAGVEVPGFAPRNVRAKLHNLQTVRIDWDEPEIPIGVIQGYKVFYTTKPDLPISLWMNKEVTGDNKMTTISGLIPNSTYTICVLAYSSVGQGPLSTPVKVMTRQGVSAPRNVRAQLHNLQTIRIDWDEPEIPHDVIQGYKVLYTKEPDLPIVLWMNQEVTGDNKVTTISGLIPDSTYTICVLAYSSVGQGPLSTPVKVMTRQGVPGSPPRNVRAQFHNLQTVRIDWDEPEIPNGVIQGYKVFYSAYQDLPFTLWMNQEVTGDNKVTTISGLIPNSTYIFCVLAYSSVGQGPLSTPVKVMTRQGVPGSPPRNVRAQPHSLQTIRIDWDEPEIPNGVIQGYKVLYTKEPDLPILLWMNQEVTGDNKVTTISGLIPNSTYTICVLAYSSFGQGPLSTPVKVKTRQGGVVWVSQPRNRNVTVGRNVTLPCEVVDPNNNLTKVWMKGTQLIFINGVPTITTPTRYSISGTNTLSIMNVQLVDDSYYTCSIFTFDNVEVKLTVISEEPMTPMLAPIGLEAQVLSSNSIVLAWTDNSLGKIQRITDSRYYMIRFTSIPGQGKYKYVNSTELFILIDDLKPDTLYEFSVRVFKGSRKSTWSTAVSNRTQEAAPGSIPRDLTPLSVEGDPLAVTLTWQPPLIPNGQITVLGYLVFYTTDPNKDDLDWVVEGVIGEKLSMTITDLTPDTTYYFKVQARNSKGYGPMSPTIIYKTPYKPNDFPSNLKLVSVRVNSAVLQWDAVDTSTDAMQGQFKGYKIRLWKKGERNATEWVTMVKGTQFSNKEGADTAILKETAVVDDLTLNSDLEAEVLASYTNYDSKPSNTIAFQTSAEEPFGEDKGKFVIRETPKLYKKFTMPFIKSQLKNLQWVYRILEKRNQLEEIIFEDPDLETGFIMLPANEWNMTDNSSSNIVAIVNKPGIHSLRDLDGKALPLLRNILNRGQNVMLDKFGIPPVKLNTYVKYQPAFYYFHVLFKHVDFKDPGFRADQAHLLRDIIDNIERNSQWYNKKTLTYVLDASDDLYLKIKKSRYFVRN